MMTWQQYMTITTPTEKQIAAYCKKHDIDFQTAYQNGDWDIVGGVLQAIGAANLKKRGITVKTKKE